MEVNEVLADAFERVEANVHAVVAGLSQEHLDARPDPEANSIAWLVWHIARVQDDHVADAAGHGQVWLDDGWHDRFGLPLEAGDTGFGHSPEQVGRVHGVPGASLADYYDAVHTRTVDYLSGLTAPDLDRIVDDSWDPPVSLGVRLVSVADDNLEHVGQAAYVRGLLEAR